MIMMNSEQEEGRHRVSKQPSNEKPQDPPLPIQKQTDDIQKFYEELMGNNSISIQVATNLPVIST